MMSYTCENCGYELSAEMAFCPKCGSQTQMHALSKIKKLCAEFLNDTVWWLPYDETDARFYVEKYNLLKRYKALGDHEIYLCCDMSRRQNGHYGYAITSSGVYWGAGGWWEGYEYYSFEDLAFEEITMGEESGCAITVCTSEGGIGFDTVVEGEKFFELLNNIVAIWENSVH